MALEVPLDRMQRWLQAVFVQPGTPAEAVATPQAEREVPARQITEVIRPSATLSALERLGVYQGMYLLRMKEALAADYPALMHFLGEPAFDLLLRAYVQAHPSRSYSLNPLGEHLPAFIATSPVVPRRAFCQDLARLELTMSQVFDAEETPPLTPERIAAVPADAWEQARLVPIAACRLLELRYNANAYLQSIREASPTPPTPRRRDSFVLVYRRDYRVYRLALSRPARELLAALLGGAALGDAVRSACQCAGRPPGQAQLFRWFRDWVSCGIFASVALS